MKKSTLILFFLCQLTPLLYSQNYPQDFFRLPVDTIVRLGGNFGEIRWDHFHYGWDVRTGGHEGMKVVAAGDGYVSRVKTGAYGYGKVIYITHPNGYVSVYAHLSEFNSAIGNYVKAVQYKNESYETDLYPAKDELKIKKGEFIALSGNTGNSSGPHLHFEIRDEKTEEIINPYFFGLKIEDTIKPYFKTLAIYRSKGQAQWTDPLKYIPLVKKNGVYQFKTKDSVIVSGETGFGIEVYDKENNSNGNNQVYSLEFQVDGKRIYYYEMTRFYFDQTLFVNAHIDYKEQRKNNKNIQKAFLLPGNKFPIYKDVLNSGILSFDKDTIHTGKFIAKDYHGNISEFSFKIFVGAKQKSVKELPSKFSDERFEELSCPNGGSLSPFEFDKEINYSDTSFFKLKIPANSFYENYIYAQCTDYTNPNKGILNLKKKLPHTYSFLYQIYGKYIPIHHKYSLSLKLDTALTDSLKNKLVIVSVNEKGKVLSAEGGEFKDGWVTTETRDFGNFVISIDSTKPKIKAQIIPKTKNISKIKILDFRVVDNLTGIKFYRATIDGKWFLMEYEPKKNSLFCKNDDRIPSGAHQISLKVTDGKGNSSSLLFDYVK